MKTLLFLALLAIPSLAHARANLNHGVFGIFQNDGDKGEFFETAVGTTTAVQLYDAAAKHRAITIQNPSADYFLYLGTHSAVSASTGARVFVPKGGSIEFNSTFDIWGIYESGAGAGVSVLGGVEYDSKD